MGRQQPGGLPRKDELRQRATGFLETAKTAIWPPLAIGFALLYALQLNLDQRYAQQAKDMNDYCTKQTAVIRDLLTNPAPVTPQEKNQLLQFCDAVERRGEGQEDYVDPGHGGAK